MVLVCEGWNRWIMSPSVWLQFGRKFRVCIQRQVYSAKAYSSVKLPFWFWLIRQVKFYFFLQTNLPHSALFKTTGRKKKVALVKRIQFPLEDLISAQHAVTQQTFITEHSDAGCRLWCQAASFTLIHSPGLLVSLCLCSQVLRFLRKSSGKIFQIADIVPIKPPHPWRQISKSLKLSCSRC